MFLKKIHRIFNSDDVYDEGEDVEADLDGIKKLPNGNYRLKLPVSPVFFKYIIGKEGRTKKGIERDTECRLWLPPKGREGDVGQYEDYCTIMGSPVLTSV